MSQINNQITQSLFNSLANSVRYLVLNSAPNITRFTTRFRTRLFFTCPGVQLQFHRSNFYAMLMRWISYARFCVGNFFPYNRSSRMLTKTYNNDSNLFTHAQIRPTLFLKIFNDIVVSPLPLNDCGSLAFHENWGKASCQDDFMNNLDEMNHC